MLFPHWLQSHSLNHFFCSVSSTFMFLCLTVPYSCFIPSYSFFECFSLRKLGASFSKAVSPPQHCSVREGDFITPFLNLLRAPWQRECQRGCAHSSYAKQRASADRLVGDKSNSVTPVAGVMLRGWQSASPSNRCQNCECVPSPKTHYHQQSSVGRRRKR